MKSSLTGEAFLCHLIRQSRLPINLKLLHLLEMYLQIKKQVVFVLAADCVEIDQ